MFAVFFSFVLIFQPHHHNMRYIHMHACICPYIELNSYIALLLPVFSVYLGQIIIIMNWQICCQRREQVNIEEKEKNIRDASKQENKIKRILRECSYLLCFRHTSHTSIKHTQRFVPIVVVGEWILFNIPLFEFKLNIVGLLSTNWPWQRQGALHAHEKPILFCISDEINYKEQEKNTARFRREIFPYILFRFHSPTPHGPR